MSCTGSYLGLDMTKCVFGVSYKARLKPVSSATETSSKIAILIACSKFIFKTFQKANNKGADQSAPLLYANPEDRFSHFEAHNMSLLCSSYEKILLELWLFLYPATKVWRGIMLYPSVSVRPSVRAHHFRSIN